MVVFILFVSVAHEAMPIIITMAIINLFILYDVLLCSLLGFSITLYFAAITLWLHLALMVALRHLAVLAAHCCQLREVYLQLSARHNTHISDYGVVVWMLMVKLIALGAQVSADV